MGEYLPGLEIAPSGWSGGAMDPVMYWKDAIKAAKRYRGGGCDDWRLPTSGEFFFDIHPRRDEIPGLTACMYWTSDSEDALHAGTWDFQRGEMGIWSKRDDGGRNRDGTSSTLIVRVRPVRGYLLPST